jgi:cell division protein FtsB
MNDSETNRYLALTVDALKKQVAKLEKEVKELKA